ncbi:MAG: hypothetical protein HY903_04160 [Deltaproteobacteria bacterium]|nr:hypothetical protein [Deltaproteobacteria bacterium]
MTRVDDNRDVQQAVEKRRQEEIDRTKAREKTQDFSRVISQKQDTVKKSGERQGQQSETLKQGQKSQAQTALLARQGIQGKNFQQELQGRGDASRGEKAVQSKSRDSESSETRRASDEGQMKADKKKVDQQGDKLAAISRDDRGKNQGGGDMGGGKESGAGGDKMPGQGLPMAAAQGQMVTSTAKTEGAAGARLPQDVLQAIVDKVFVGMNKEGLSEFHIQFKDNVLAGSSLKISAKDGKVSATFNTTNSGVKRLIESSEGELSRAFSAKGMTLERLEVRGP